MRWAGLSGAAELDHQRVPGARRALGVFTTSVDRLERNDKLTPRDAYMLRDSAIVITDQLPQAPEDPPHSDGSTAEAAPTGDHNSLP